MYCKLSAKNVKRSLKDYAIYFLTLTFSVCIFYVFNSISTQQMMLELSENQVQFLGILNNMLGAISLFIAIVLGFLIVYANNFLIKRRKKELGLYMVLGMEKRKISYILFLETLFIGIISLAFGLLLGIFLSQGLSVLTAKLFNTTLKQFSFVFSLDAAIATILCFGVMFLCVILFNTISVSKYKLIDLLQGERKNERLRTGNVYVSSLLLILSAAALGISYRLILENNLMMIDWKFITSILLGGFGTFLFFMSVSGIVLRLVQMNRKLYYKGLNMFVLRQINSKINTTFASMSVICLMLFVTIGMLSSGLSINSAMMQSLDILTPYDFTFASPNRGENRMDLFERYNIPLDDYVKECVSYSEYTTHIEESQMLTISGETILYTYGEVAAITQSAFNELMKMQGRDGVQMADDEFLMISTALQYENDLNKMIENGLEITIGEKQYHLYQNSFEFVNTANRINVIQFVLPDAAVTGLERSMDYMAVNFRPEVEDAEAKLFAAMNEVTQRFDKGIIFVSENSRQEVRDQHMSLSTYAVFIGIYIGLIFLIAGAAVLALQQVSETTDNMKRYAILRKIGADETMVNRSVLMQILIYFLAPLALAAVHSVVGLKVANTIVTSFGKSDILTMSLATGGVIVLIYGGYLLVTYLSSKNIIRTGQKIR